MQCYVIAHKITTFFIILSAKHAFNNINTFTVLYLFDLQVIAFPFPHHHLEGFSLMTESNPDGTDITCIHVLHNNHWLKISAFMIRISIV